MTDKLTNLERTLNSTDTEKKQLQDRVVKLKNVRLLSCVHHITPPHFVSVSRLQLFSEMR